MNDEKIVHLENKNPKTFKDVKVYLYQFSKLKLIFKINLRFMRAEEVKIWR